MPSSSDLKYVACGSHVDREGTLCCLRCFLGIFKYTKYHSSYLFYSPVFKIDRREQIPFQTHIDASAS